MAERVALYHQLPSPGYNIPISVDTFQVDDSVPMEDKVKWVVSRLRTNLSRGSSGIRVEHLREWVKEARKAEAPEAETEVETVGGTETGMDT